MGTTAKSTDIHETLEAEGSPVSEVDKVRRALELIAETRDAEAARNIVEQATAAAERAREKADEARKIADKANKPALSDAAVAAELDARDVRRVVDQVRAIADAREALERAAEAVQAEKAEP